MKIPIKDLYYMQWRGDDNVDTLVFDIAKNGLREPIEVRPYRPFLWWLRPTKYVVISGARRVQAMRKLCHTEIECHVQKYFKCPYSKVLKRFK
jgi:ParB-like chromosome segregation protein Spo0J